MTGLAAAAAVGAATAGAVTLAGHDERGAATWASSEPLRKALLVAPAQPSPERDAATEAEENRPAQLGFPAPSESRVGSAGRALAEFMAAWRDRRVSIMETWTAVDAGVDTRRWLVRRYGPWRLRGWAIRDRRRLARPDALRYEVTIAVRTLPDPALRRRDLSLRVVRRAGDGSPAGATGRWGVDPLPPLDQAIR